MEYTYPRVILCIKPVKSSLMGEVSIGEDSFVINPYEMKILIELAELRKNMDSKFTLTCIAMGAKSAESALRRALAIGADEAVLISDSAFAGSDTVATSYIVSEAIRKIENISLIICGSRSIDGETGQVPGGICERLKYSLYTGVSKICSFDKNEIIFSKDDGEMISTHKGLLPAVILYNNFSTSEPNISLMALKKAKRKEITIINAETLKPDISRCGLSGSKTKVSEIQSSFVKKSGKCFSGTSQETAHFLSDILKGVSHD